MNRSSDDKILESLRRETGSPGEDTLRLIAGLPAPAGLSDRVQAGLRAVPHTRGILIRWASLRPPFGWMHSGLVRGAAAAAIVCVVAGGGWRIYSRVQPAGAAKNVIVPAPVSPRENGFSNAGAKRVPDTLEGPVLTHPVAIPPEINVIEKVPAQSSPVPGTTTTKKKRSSRSAVVPLQ